jgi:hypothetical protein
VGLYGLGQTVAVDSAIIASASSLAGVVIGMAGNWFLARRQERLQERREHAAEVRESTMERRRLAGSLADALISPLRGLRGLDEQYFEELVDDVFLPKHWYGKYEPALLRLIGDVDDDETRRTLTEIVTSLGRQEFRPNPRAGYHYTESQLLLGLEVVNALGRGQALDATARDEIAALRERREQSSAD